MDKLTISEALVKAMDNEDIHTREAGRILNIAPFYVSMAKNPKMHDSMSRAAWERIEDWFLSRIPLNSYKFPEGEEVWKPKEKPAIITADHTATEKEGPEEHSPEAILPDKKDKPGKSVKIILQNAEIEKLHKRIDDLEKNTNNNFSVHLKKITELYSEIRTKTEQLEEGISHLVTLPKQTEKPVIVIFQRNIYKS